MPRKKKLKMRDPLKEDFSVGLSMLYIRVLNIMNLNKIAGARCAIRMVMLNIITVALVSNPCTVGSFSNQIVKGLERITTFLDTRVSRSCT